MSDISDSVHQLPSDQFNLTRTTKKWNFKSSNFEHVQRGVQNYWRLPISLFLSLFMKYKSLQASTIIFKHSSIYFESFKKSRSPMLTHIFQISLQMSD